MFENCACISVPCYQSFAILFLPGRLGMNRKKEKKGKGKEKKNRCSRDDTAC